jgi:hypothetical protein
MCIVPKFSLIDSWFWFHLLLNYLYLVALLNLNVSYAFMFCYSMKDKLKTICYVFPYDLNTCLIFIVLFSWSFVCVLLHVITWLLSFFYQDYIFYAHVLSSFDPSTQCLHRWSRLCRCISPQKLFFVITYLLEDKHELSLGCLIHLKRIYNFWCSMLVFTPFA